MEVIHYIIEKTNSVISYFSKENKNETDRQKNMKKTFAYLDSSIEYIDCSNITLINSSIKNLPSLPNNVNYLDCRNVSIIN